MVKTAAVLLGAALSAALGAALHLRAYSPALGWESSWPAPLNRWQDPGTEGGLLLTGMLLLATGLALIVVTAHRLVAGAGRSPAARG
jgi:hypothetical protein